MVSGSLRVLPASSTTKTGRHDIAEILLKVALSTINQIKAWGDRFPEQKCMLQSSNIMFFLKFW
jgi:hypothetical protein